MKRVVLGAALALGLALPAGAIDSMANLKIANMRAATPSCSANPGPVVGRVSGEVGVGSGERGAGPRLAGFVGCFPNVGSCELWRLRTLGGIDGRITDSRCEPR